MKNVEEGLDRLCRVLLDILHDASHVYTPTRENSPLGSPRGSPRKRDDRDNGADAASSPPPMPLRSRLQQMTGAERIEEASNFACHPICIAHEVFGIEYLDLPRCSFCHATGEPNVTSSFLYRVYVAELLAVHSGAGTPSTAP